VGLRNALLAPMVVVLLAVLLAPATAPRKPALEEPDEELAPAA